MIVGWQLTGSRPQKIGLQMIRKTSKEEKNENYSNRLELMKRIDK
jgi:hypothetical protein